ncbi:MAG TPA: sulfite exporter TauE/SafE family protein [Flavobacteriales bacterium]|nr:sulfite exporter TauE/SafE family protein [Flavobacteriales bacterium]
MEEITIALTAVFASALTFFSGFGLATILTPVFVFFFPIEIAIALTGVVHLSNNIFKLLLIGKNIDYSVFLKFGIPALMGSLIGALLLLKLGKSSLAVDYQFLGFEMHFTLVKFIIALVLLTFSVMELLPFFEKLEFSKGALVPGGILSGFFGGLSGHQGALRTAFLIKLNLSKEAFIATGVSIACVVDFIRIPVYFSSFHIAHLQDNMSILLIATGSAFAGALIGRKVLTKATYGVIKVGVGVFIILVALALGVGLI